MGKWLLAEFSVAFVMYLKPMPRTAHPTAAVVQPAGPEPPAKVYPMRRFEILLVGNPVLAKVLNQVVHWTDYTADVRPRTSPSKALPARYPRNAQPRQPAGMSLSPPRLGVCVQFRL